MAGAALAALLQGCSGPEKPTATPAPTQAPAQANDWFVDVAARSGLDFVHRSGRAGQYYLPEIMSGGCAFVDYDNDGDLDVFMVQAGLLEPPGDAAGRSSRPRTGKDADRLYRNDSVPGAGALRFTDVTAKSGIATRGYGQGVAVGDFDNDGWADLYVTSFGPNQLLRNRGDSTFEDVTGTAGADDPRWSTSASFLDFDRDGWLDLFVANYVAFAFPVHKPCYYHGRVDYCSPLSYEPLSHRLLRNRGDSTFEDVSERSRVLTERGNGLGVVAADLDGDGWIDLYVANDQMPNLLWKNQRDGTFRDVGLESGAALSADGSSEASMGVDAGDVDEDGDLDLFMTHLLGGKNTLYVSEGGRTFDDASVRSGVSPPSQTTTGFGTAWVDYDNDGRLDLMVANGSVSALPALLEEGDPFPYAQRNQLFRNEGTGRLRDVSAQAGAAFQLRGTSRGAAFGDVDNDGDVDVLVGQIDGPVRLLQNQVGSRQHWLGVRLLTGGRDALGARAVLRSDGGSSLWRRVRADGSYLSASDPRIVFGLGAGRAGAVLEVHWPDGTRERFRDLPHGRYTSVSQGSGERVP